MITLNSIGDFTWSFGQTFHIELMGSRECYEWSDPDYGGDNTIRPCGKYHEWLDKNNLEFGRDKGTHKIKDYCGKDVIILEE